MLNINNKIYMFQNIKGHSIQIPGPDGETVTFKKFEKKVLSEWFSKYCPSYLVIVTEIKDHKNINTDSNKGIKYKSVQENKSNKVVATNKNVKNRNINRNTNKNTSIEQMRNNKLEQKELRNKILNTRKRLNKPVVGRYYNDSVRSTEYYKKITECTDYPLSNDIGIGILSYNRLECIKRLIQSIRKYTNLNKTTIIVSDESTNKDIKDWLKKQTDIIVLDNKDNIGIAGNMNRLLRCLDRFKYKMILNDDVEILKEGWEKFYFNMMKNTGYHHFCFRQVGVYGASIYDITNTNVNGMIISTVKEKPHGAIMAFDDIAFSTVGYFDEKFGKYGMEHVDWSHRVSISKIQPSGYHDINGSQLFFKIHMQGSAIIDKSKYYNDARKYYDKVKTNNNRIYIKPTDLSKVPEVTYIIPFRDTNRNEAIIDVIRNIKSQLFPRIEIILMEHDTELKVKSSFIDTIKHYLSNSNKSDFTKSKAINDGIKYVTTNMLVLHDADMIIESNYTKRIYDLLMKYDGVHIGKNVLYLDRQSSANLHKDLELKNNYSAERWVTYFEGGSLGCTKDTFIKIGGFDERFIGYGCEDCDFFERLSTTNFYNKRESTFIHIWHSRTRNWDMNHEKNKLLYAKISHCDMKSRIRDCTNKLKDKL